MEKKSSFIILFFVLFSNFTVAQVTSVDSLTVENDSIFNVLSTAEDSMQVYMLKEIMVFNRPQFENWEERKRFYILRRKTKKVYPFAVLASKRLKELDKRLEKIDSKRRRKKYTKTIETYIKKEFGPELKNYTQSEGRIMIKLIYRQIGVSTYDILKEYRSGWKAFWSNTTAKLFNLDLKSKYNPFKYRDDLLIESILQEAYEDGSLEYEAAFWERLNHDNDYFLPLTEEEKDID